MTKTTAVKNLIFQAKKDSESAIDLYKSNHYDWSLFLWHLAIEKLLKAKIILLDKQVIFTHNLILLAKSSELKISEQLEDELKEITSYNIAARYDDYKLSFYKKADNAYTKKWIAICKKIYQLIRNSL